MRKLLSPGFLRQLVRQLRVVRRGGGPRRIEVLHVAEPKGILAPGSEVLLRVEAKDGTVSDVETVIPIAWPYAWGYRAARLLHLPLVSRFDPERIRFAVRVPGRG